MRCFPLARCRLISTDGWLASTATYFGRSGTPWFVDPEGQVVWVQEFTRYVANGCDVATASARVFAQIDGQPAGPLCAPPASNAVVAFPPRDQVIAFILLLDVKYQQMGRAAILSVVDREGLVVWLMEYLRYSTNGCDHETASANTLTQITAKAAPPPVCRKPPCSYHSVREPKTGGSRGRVHRDHVQAPRVSATGRPPASRYSFTSSQRRAPSPVR